MKTVILLLTTTLFLSSSALFANSAPVVSNVSASQRGDGSKLVDISYDLTDADGDNCTVWIAISDDDGVTWDVPAFTVSGDLGTGVAPGTGKQIIWDAGHDIVGKVGDFKTRVLADDGNIDDMVFVAPGNFPHDNSTWTFVPGYYIDKYEVTNQRYCEFLNSADPDGLHWESDQEITRQGTVGDYYYFVEPDRENYPLRYVSFHDAEAYAQWLSSSTGLNYRLPDKYEWQKAAAWDPVEQHFYTYGFHSDTIDCTKCNYNNCVGEPTVVGSYAPNKSYYGCFDMSGNVREWTSEPVGSARVPGGGYFGISETACTVTYYTNYASTSRYNILGFRLVLDPN